MTDIAKCDGKDCPLADSCWRFKAPCGDWQTYIEPKKRGEECEYYWKIEAVVQRERNGKGEE